MPPAINSSGNRVHKRRRPLNSGGTATTKPQGRDNAGEVDPPRIMPPTPFERVSKRKHPNSTSPIKKNTSVGGNGDVSKTTNNLKLNHRHEGLNSSHGLKANSLLNATHVTQPVKRRSTPRLQLSTEEIVERELKKRPLRIKTVLRTNLTNNYLIKTFPDLPLSKVVDYIKRHHPNCEFTPGEKELLEKFFERDELNGPMGEEVFGHFPIRSKKYICNMYGRLQYCNMERFLHSRLQIVSLALKVPRKSQPIREPFTDAYDPKNIMSDTRVPLHGRQFYLPELYTNQNLPANPRYPEPDSGFDSRCPVGTDVPNIDDLAVKTCKNSPKWFTLLSENFSRSFGESSMKYSPVIMLRFYFFPGHCASYTICNPRGGYFDPIIRIGKFWQVCYSLYFSYLARLQSIIFQLQEDLIAAWNNDDASEILFLVDKWNLLMLFLSPNRQAVENIVNNNEIDINQTWRMQLSENGVKLKSVTLQDLALGIWVDEIMEKSIPHTLFPKSEQVRSPQFLLPPNFYVRSRQRIREQKTLLRLAVHLILDNAYARIVSPENSTLRKYTTGTPEVFGELLFPFVSEIFTILQIKPDQLFYDLGMALGLICHQLWLEFGVKSGGCEIRKDLLPITMALDRWLTNHLLMLGIQPQQINFELGKLFVGNQKVENELKHCSVVLVPNKLFDLKTNDGVKDLLNCLRDGSKVISLCDIYRDEDLKELTFNRITVRKELSQPVLVSWSGLRQDYYIMTVHREN